MRLKARTILFLVITAVVWYASLEYFCSLNQNLKINVKKSNPQIDYQNIGVPENKLEKNYQQNLVIPRSDFKRKEHSLINSFVSSVTSIKNLIFKKPEPKLKLEPYESSVLNEPWDKKNDPIVFLHIGKNGGTSFDSSIKPVVKKLGGKYVGDKHFDWTFVEGLEKPDSKPNVVLQKVKFKLGVPK